MYTSKLTILGHFLKTLSMIHMPPKPIASVGSDTSIILMWEINISNQHIHPNSSILFYFFKNFLNEIYMPPKPLAMNYRAALATIHSSTMNIFKAKEYLNIY